MTMKKIIFSLIVASTFAFTSCNSGGSYSQQDRPKTPEELRMELKFQEQINPNKFLTVSATMSPNKVKIREAGLFRDAEYGVDGYNIEGTITNTATIARFKDVVLTVTFMSQTETIIEEKDHVIYEYYEPNTTKEFSLHLYPPDATEIFNITLKNATAID
jgi:hypothetical protein